MRTLTILCFIPIVAWLKAQTTISGGIFADATWTVAQSPYHVIGDVVVFDGLTLTVEPGVVVKVDSGVTIELRNSRLTALGTASQPITFERSGTARWKGFKVVGSQYWSGYQVRMEHCLGSGANKLLDFDWGYDPPYEFVDCEFFDNIVCSWEGGGSFVQNAWLFERCSFHDNMTALNSGYLHTIIDCTFENNGTASAGGHWVSGCTFVGNDMALTTGHDVDGNTFMNNVVAVEGSWAGQASFTNNVVVGNGTGVRMGPFYNGSSVFTGNVVCRNTVWNVERYYNVQSNDMADLSGNCFCSDDPAAIEQTIYHAVDDVTVGLIVFTPFDSGPGCLDFHIGVPDHASVELGVYPNPVTDRLTVSLPTGLAEQLSLTLSDATGRVVRTRSVVGGTVQWDLADLPNGTYQVVLHSKDGFAARRVFVLH